MLPLMLLLMMLLGGCGVSRRTQVANTEVLIWRDNRHGFYEDDGAPYRHIDDVTRPTLRHLTSSPSTNSNAAFHCANIINLVFASFIQNTGYIQRLLGL